MKELAPMTLPIPDSRQSQLRSEPQDDSYLQAELAIEQRDFKRGIDLLNGTGNAAAPGAPRLDAQAQALLGLAHFQRQEYDAAARHYGAALRVAPAGADASSWREMLALAEANATAHVNVHVPDKRYFAREALLASPPPPALPAAPPPAPLPSFLRGLCQALGDALGVVATAIVELMTYLYGWFAGYRDRVWTNWYHRPQFLAILTLAYMRNLLNARNLATSYPPERLVGFQPSVPSAPPRAPPS